MFRVRCRNCARTVLSGVERIGPREADALVAHLERCRSDLAHAERSRWASDLGVLLAHFDVATTENEA
jgi:hypothetical protein